MAKEIFFDLAIMVIVAAMGGYLARLFKQPLIPAYLLAGVIFGPSALGVITDTDVIKTLAEIGIAFLLFVVGLELEWARLKTAATVAVFGGLLQMSIIFFVGFGLALLLGFLPLESIYLGLILTFSSTLVIVKMLSDKRELDTLHGRILIGILLLQDLVAIGALSVLPVIDHFTPAVLGVALLKGVSLIIVAFFLSKYIFPTIYKVAAKSNEVLLLMSITVCFFFSLFANALGFSIAIGGFIAGISLATLPYNFEIIARVKPLRDFFATLFFVSLGMSLSLITLPSLIIPIIVFLIFVLFFQSLITMVIIKIFGYTTKTSFFIGFTLSQVSEFSFIIAGLGVSLGHIQNNIFSLAVVLAIITIVITSYFVRDDYNIYRASMPWLQWLNKIGGTYRDLNEDHKKEKYNVVLIGLDRIGYNLLRTLRKAKKSVLVIDYNPEMIRKCKKEKIDCIYGDVEDLDIIERLDLSNTSLLVSTIENVGTSMFLTGYAKKKNKKIMLFVTARKLEDGLRLYQEGADYVILPYYIGGDHVSLMMEETELNINKLMKHRKDHIKELKHHMIAGEFHENHEHPFLGMIR